MTTTATALEPAFSRVLVRELIVHVPALRDREVVTTSGDASVLETLQLLTSKGFLSCPVRASDSGEWIGFIDMLDILSFIVEECTEEHHVNMPGRGDVQWLSWCQNPERLRSKGGQDLAKVPTEQIMNKSRCDPWCPIEDTGNLFQLLESLANVHRVPVRDAQGHIQHIVTQSAVVHFLNANMKVIGDLATRTLAELGLMEQSIISMSESAEAIVGFHTLRFNKVTGLAVVNKSGQYVCTLSVSDLKGLGPETFDKLLEPCSKYIADRKSVV